MNNEKIGKSIFMILGGFFVLNTWSFAVLIITNEWFSVSEIVRILNSEGAMTSVIVVKASAVIGTVIMVHGIVGLYLKFITYYVKKHLH